MSEMSATVEKLAHPNEVSGTASIGWWGTILLIANETISFIVLLSVYFYLRANSLQWLPVDASIPDLILPIVATTILFISTVFAQMSLQTLQNTLQGRSTLFLLSSLAFGAVFIAIQLYATSNLSLFPPENAYETLFLVIIAIHLLHVLIGLVAMTFVSMWVAVGEVTSNRRGYLQNVVLYWHFVVLIWLIIFAVLFLSIRF